MSRAAILPTPCDPFQMTLWWDMFKRNAMPNLDKLYVHINSSLQEDVRKFVRKQLSKDPRVVVIEADSMIGHGEAIKQTLKKVKEDYVMLIEDDCVVFKPAFDDLFMRLETKQVDIVGSWRQSASENVAWAAQQKFHFPTCLEQFFWPNLFITDTERLRKTDQNFGSRQFEVGEYVKELDWIVDGPVGNDTFVWASIQLRSTSPRIEWIEQYHAQVDDPDFERQGYRAWNGEARWVHIGSLSSMMMNFLLDDEGYPLMHRGVGTPHTNFPMPKEIEEDAGKQEIESRFAHTILAYEYAKDRCSDIQEFVDVYGRALDKPIYAMGLQKDRIRYRVNMYRRLYGIAQS